jgi:2-polyprenyl-3-methyl-5-hydroxy-6-metoxy-1,4-benzoquinol methylase
MSNYLTFILNSINRKFSSYVAKSNAKNNFKNGVITFAEYKLKKEFLKTTQQFGVTEFYQSYPPLNFPGTRNTLSRVKTYNLKKYVNKRTKVLDIGGNIGFFSTYVARFVKSVLLIEQNKKLTDIGKNLLTLESIKNMNILNQDFKKFKSEKKYDVIFSLAIHKWVGMTFETYIAKLLTHLNKKGLILLESHIIYSKNKNEEMEERLLKIKGIKIIDKGLIDDHNGFVREFYWVKKK